MQQESATQYQLLFVEAENFPIAVYLILLCTWCIKFVYDAGMSIRSKVGSLRRMYGTVEDAEAAVGLTVDAYMSAEAQQPEQQQPPVFPRGLLRMIRCLSAGELESFLAELFPLLPFTAFLQHIEQTAKVAQLQTAMLSLFEKYVYVAPQTEAAELLDKLTSSLVKSHGFSDREGSRVVSTTLNSMTELSKAGHNPYLVGKFAQCIATKRPGSSESLMPLSRMPFGMIQYQVEFFTAAHVSKVIL